MNKNDIDYCRLPSIPCSKRTGNADAYFPENTEYCSLFNPDQVHKIFSNGSKIKNINKYEICYKDYPEDGRPGDYTCQINSEGRCVGQPRGCEVDKKTKKRIRKKGGVEYLFYRSQDYCRNAKQVLTLTKRKKSLHRLLKWLPRNISLCSKVSVITKVPGQRLSHSKGKFFLSNAQKAYIH